MQILILEDEHFSGKKLINLVQEASPDAEIIWEKSIVGARKYLAAHQVNLIFSDIELLDGNVFDLFKTCDPNCPIIFCTAYNDYLLDAFNTNGIAYITKPYSKADVNQAWNKFQKLFFNYQKPDLDILKPPTAQQAKFKNQFIVKKTKGVIVIDVDNVLFFRVSGDYVIAYMQDGKNHLLNQALREISHSIDPKKFVQINRGEMVNIDFVLEFEPYIKNRLSIKIRNYAKPLLTSNRRSKEFKQVLLSRKA